MTNKGISGYYFYKNTTLKDYYKKYNFLYNKKIRLFQCYRL